MAKFLNPDKLIKEIEDLFEDAEEYLFIVSPFIKLDKKLKQILEPKKSDSNFQVVLLYGKNESNHNQSLGNDDLSFFKEFKNVDIYYHPDLHAKYYANDFRSIVTSLNLLAFSIANNIEVGVLFERKGRFSVVSDNKEDDKSFTYFENVLKESEHIFGKHLEQEKSVFGLRKSDGISVVEVDQTNRTHSTQNRQSQPSQQSSIISRKGFCIRTGVSIPYDLNKPFSKEAYHTWATFGNPDYPERFCHFSGNQSNGETSFAFPFLEKFEKEAIEIHKQIHERPNLRR